MGIEPDSAAVERFQKRDDKRPFVMVQLLCFAEGGRSRYLEYSVAAQPILLRIGAKVLYAGECTEPLLAPAAPGWDAIVVVRYPTRSAYAELLSDPAYRALADLRRQALRDAALLPMDDWAGR